jgi:hypothetical protein
MSTLSNGSGSRTVPDREISTFNTYNMLKYIKHEEYAIFNKYDALSMPIRVNHTESDCHENEKQFYRLILFIDILYCVFKSQHRRWERLSAMHIRWLFFWVGR